jgi:hypothetical protein
MTTSYEPVDYAQFPTSIRAYWEALGRFSHTFTAVERLMGNVLWVMSGTSLPVAQAVFSGDRIATAQSKIQRIIAAQAAHGFHLDDAELKDAFNRLGPITDMRNAIMHYGAHQREDNIMTVTNIIHAHTEDRLQEREVSPALLDAMTSDLQKISAILTVYFLRTSMPADDLDNMVRPLRERPWLYKPKPQSPRHSKNQQRSRRQPPQPESSAQ